MNTQTIIRFFLSIILYFIAVQLMENDSVYEKLAIMILIASGLAIQESKW